MIVLGKVIVGIAHATSLAGLKRWESKVIDEIFNNTFSDRFTHIFSLVTPLLTLATYFCRFWRSSIACLSR